MDSGHRPLTSDETATCFQIHPTSHALRLSPSSTPAPSIPLSDASRPAAPQSHPSPSNRSSAPRARTQSASAAAALTLTPSPSRSTPARRPDTAHPLSPRRLPPHPLPPPRRPSSPYYLPSALPATAGCTSPAPAASKNRTPR